MYAPSITLLVSGSFESSSATPVFSAINSPVWDTSSSRGTGNGLPEAVGNTVAPAWRTPP